jgi:hypothetical protein
VSNQDWQKVEDLLHQAMALAPEQRAELNSLLVVGDDADGLSTDDDLKNLRSGPRFQQLVATLRRPVSSAKYRFLSLLPLRQILLVRLRSGGIARLYTQPQEVNSRADSGFKGCRSDRRARRAGSSISGSGAASRSSEASRSKSHRAAIPDHLHRADSGRDQDTEYTRSLVRARLQFAAEHHLNSKDFYLVSLPGLAAFSLLTDTGAKPCSFPCRTIH